MRRMILRAGITALAVALAALVALIVLARTGVAERWARAWAVIHIEKATGARVDLGAFHFRLWGLRAELDNLTLHGREPAGLPPLFHAERITAHARVFSLFGRKVALDEVIVERPAVAVRIDAHGQSNVPAPQRRRPARPWRERLFDLRIGKLRLENGYAMLNDVRVPLAVEGKHLELALGYEAPASGPETYAGRLSWRRVELAARRYLPFLSDLELKFTLTRDSFSLDELRWRLPHSEIDVRADLGSFSRPEWNFRYRARLALEDLRHILRKPHMPTGEVQFSGAAAYAEGKLGMSGHFAARDVTMRYPWFHTGGLESWGDYTVANRRLEVPEFQARVLGGELTGRMQMDFPGLAFRVDSQARGVNLARLLAAVDHRGFPVHTLDWAGSVEVNSVSTWSADFKHFRSRGESRWAPPTATPPGEIPATARLDFDYRADGHKLALAQSEISTDTSRLEVDGFLGEASSALETRLETRNLSAWGDFINVLRGPEAPPRRITGRAAWHGRVLGPLARPTFAGHVHVTDARYDQLFWDAIDGDLEYSPDVLRLANARVRRGRAAAALDLWLQLDGNWSFRPQNQWMLAAKLDRAPTDDLQALLGWSYPVTGVLSGEFRGSGTRAESELEGMFTMEGITAAGFQFDRLRGQLRARRDEIRIAQAELQKATGRVSGNFLYRPEERTTEFSFTGTAIPLEKVRHLQTAALPVAGRLSFQLRGQGPLFAPAGEGTMELEHLQVGSEVQGNFGGRIESNGRQAQAQFASTRTTGRLGGAFRLDLAGEYPWSGEIGLEQFDLDPLIAAGLHLKTLTGHSSVNGGLSFSGSLRRPGSLVIQADISRVAFAYEFVKLENDGPVRLRYTRGEMRIEQAHLRGPDTDFRITGTGCDCGERSLDFRLAGTVNLRLASGLFPELEARGAAEVNAAVTGTYRRPSITGRVRVSDASARYADFPAGLSHIAGEFRFDRDRLVFDRVAAESGGGALVLSGLVSYSNGPFHYHIGVEAPQVRVRYPEGTSWLAGGTLQLSGDARAAILSGKVTVDRLLFGEGTDLVSLLAAAQAPARGPATTSPYLRNLRLDIEAHTGPGARMEWTGGQVETEGSLRLRGAWDHPVLLGHVHLLAGEMDFRGNRFQLTRGDINFSNPFRFDPILDVEATTVINQYEITMNFSGPLSRMSLSYRSDPPLPDSDVIALLALGSPGEESALRSSTSARAQSYGATALLSEAISSQLGGRIERLFGISRFRVDPFLAGTATEQNAAARVTIEQQVARGLTITYSTNASSSQQQVIQVEYAVRRDVSIVALRDINGTFGLDIKFKKHFK